MILYDFKNYLGSSLTVTSSISELEFLGDDWNDRISAIKVIPKNLIAGECYVTGFKEADFAGEAYYFQASNYNQGQVVPFWGWLGSFRFAGPCDDVGIEVFSGANYDGQRGVVYGSELGDDGIWAGEKAYEDLLDHFSFETQSAKLHFGGLDECTACYYEDANYGGDNVCLFKSQGQPAPLTPNSMPLTEHHSFEGSSPYAAWHNEISSIRFWGPGRTPGSSGACSDAELHLFSSRSTAGGLYTNGPFVLKGADGGVTYLSSVPYRGTTHHWNEADNVRVWWGPGAGWTPPPVPDVVGETVADGVARIEAVRLVALRADLADTSDPSLVGKIYSTTPAAGTVLTAGATVHYIEYRLVVPDSRYACSLTAPSSPPSTRTAMGRTTSSLKAARATMTVRGIR